MKKYKLIKTYPGSPKLESIADKKDACNFWYINNGFNNVGKNIDQFPEFWEEIVEKDYEILSYYQESNVHGKYVYYKSHMENWEFIEKQNYKIHSVKRLSDGEVFTIGNKVRISKLQHDGSFIINKFYFDCNDEKLLCNGKCTGNGHVSITKIEHSKPLFTTEDGVDIFEGDKYYRNSGWHFESCKFIHTATKDTKFFMSDKPFSTKEKAEEYILMNKPCLSINDILEELKLETAEALKKGIMVYSIEMDKIKQLVKSKL